MTRVLVRLVYAASVATALYAIVAYSLLPAGSTVHPRMLDVFRQHPVGIYAHVFGAAVTLLVGPAQFSRSLRAARPRLHRGLGLVYLLLGVGVGGFAGLYMSAFAFGGAVSTAGFAILAVLWLYSGCRAFAAARRHRFDEHRDWMVRNFALLLAAVTLRAYLGVGLAAGLPFERFYPVLAWLCWVPNVLAAEQVLRTLRREQPALTPGAG